MSDYSKTTTFTTKDGLTTGNPAKLIKGSDFDTEFDNIATAITSKLDSTNLASQVQAEAETDNTVLMTPLRTADWSNYNAGVVGDLQALTTAGFSSADAILGWDTSASAAIGFTLGAGLSHAAAEIDIAAAVAGTGLTMTSSVLNVIGGDGITANANDIALTAAAASASNPIVIASGAFSLDLTSLTELVTATGLDATDRVYIDDAGVSKAVEIQNLGMRVQTGQATQTLAAADMNTIMEFTATATLTLPPNTTALPVGVPIVLNMKHATQELTILAGTGVTLVSTYHPAGGVAASDLLKAGGTALLYKTAADTWCLSGDIKDA
jgi:hypothetical protein